jgi:hypothetical protein
MNADKKKQLAVWGIFISGLVVEFFCADAPARQFMSVRINDTFALLIRR